MKMARIWACAGVAAVLAVGAARSEEQKKVITASSEVKVKDDKKKAPAPEPIKAPEKADDALTAFLGKALNPKEPWGDDDNKATGYKYKGAMFRTYKPTSGPGGTGAKVVVKIQLLHALRRDDHAELELNYNGANVLESARAVIKYGPKNVADTGLLASPVSIQSSENDPGAFARNVIGQRLLTKLLDKVYDLDEEGSRQWFAENTQRHLFLISEFMAGAPKAAAVAPKAEPAKVEPSKPEAAK